VDWDNLRVFLTVARSSSMLDAARMLGSSQSTVSRRVQRLEREIGRKVFERTTQGLVLTAHGHKILRQAEGIEELLTTVDTRANDRRADISGEIRLGTTEAFGTYFLAPYLARFCALHPAVTIDVLPMPRLLNLWRREADTAIAIERPATAGLVAARLTSYRLLPYATTGYLESHPAIHGASDLAEHCWVDYIDDLVFSPQQFSLKSWLPSAKPCFRSTSVLAQAQAVRSGLGVGILPCFLASQFDDLVPILADSIDITRTFWLVAPPERREVSRVRALWQYIREVAGREQGLLMGAGMNVTPS